MKGHCYSDLPEDAEHGVARKRTPLRRCRYLDGRGYSLSVRPAIGSQRGRRPATRSRVQHAFCAPGPVMGAFNGAAEPSNPPLLSLAGGTIPFVRRYTTIWP